jgi:adenosylhomocysteine nucleosidase
LRQTDVPQRARQAFLLVVSGLLAEARIAGGAGARAIVGGGNGARLAAEIDRGIGDGGGGLLSFGMAGGLEPGLAPGTIIVPGVVIIGTERFATSATWTRHLRSMLPQCVERAVTGVDRPVASVPAKSSLYATTGAVAADMESHIAARASARAGLPLAVLRVIADPSSRALPEAALAGMGDDGRPDLWAVLRRLARDPAQCRALVGVARDARRAMAVLAGCKRLLGSQFGLPLQDPP